MPDITPFKMLLHALWGDREKRVKCKDDETEQTTGFYLFSWHEGEKSGCAHANFEDMFFLLEGRFSVEAILITLACRGPSC